MTHISQHQQNPGRKKRVQKLITFSPQLAQYIEFKADKLGVSFPEYIRSLALNDIKDEVDDMIIASPEIERQIGIAIEEGKRGEGTELDPFNEKDLEELFRAS